MLWTNQVWALGKDSGEPYLLMQNFLGPWLPEIIMQ